MLRKHPNLQRIDIKWDTSGEPASTAAEFWKLFDAGKIPMKNPQTPP